MGGVNGWLIGSGVCFVSIGRGIKDNRMLSRTQRIRNAKSQHILCVVITLDVSEAGNVMFAMADVAVAMLDRIVVGRRSISLKII